MSVVRIRKPEDDRPYRPGAMRKADQNRRKSLVSFVKMALLDRIELSTSSLPKMSHQGYRGLMQVYKRQNKPLVRQKNLVYIVILRGALGYTSRAAHMLPKRQRVQKFKLTDAAVTRAELPVGSTDMVIWDSDVAGFGVRRRPIGKSWILAYRPSGAGRRANTKKMKLGTVGAVAKVADARRLAQVALGRVAQGADPLRELLGCCIRDARSDLVFPSMRTGGEISGWTKLMTGLTTTAGVDFTLHDLRRTFRTGLSRLGVDVDTAEPALGHARADLEAIYNRDEALDRLRGAFDKWAAWVEAVAGIGESRKAAV